MKKETQRTLMSAAIIITFALSSIAFVFGGFFNGGGQVTAKTQSKQLDSYVLTGEVDPQTMQSYVDAGYTFMKLYYNSSIDQKIIVFAEQAPATFTTPTGQNQLYVQKIEGPTNYVTLVNANGSDDYYNLTQDEIFNALCTRLMAASPECAIQNLTP